jgi:predicted nucleic acid-binding protein
VSRFCLDASVVLARLFREDYPLVDDFWESMARTDELVGAQLLRPECTSVIRYSVANGRVEPQDGRMMMDELLSMPLQVSQSLLQFSLAYDMAERFNLQKAYDIQYLAVAQSEGLELVTIDGGMRQRAVELRLPCRFLR